jgi:two-component system chemotaxis response regulator CheY
VSSVVHSFRSLQAASGPRALYNTPDRLVRPYDCNGILDMLALVIDDSRAVRLIIGKILREVGIEVVEAGDGREALRCMTEYPDVELVLVDWNMPEMDGLEYIRAVRSRPDYDPVRIMMVTSETEQEQVCRALDAGANEYLMKPFTKEVLIAKLSLLDIDTP